MTLETPKRTNHQEPKAGDSMIKLFQNKPLIKKICDMYPIDHPQRIWLAWGSKNCNKFKDSYEKLTNTKWPLEADYIKKRGANFRSRKFIAMFVRFMVLHNLLKDESQRSDLRLEYKIDYEKI
tara:strand:- start:375 stop:743 length:369 start_codon:yes stop_codon:yes gene_type:complete